MDANQRSTGPVAPGANGLPAGTRVAVLFQRFGPYHHARLNAAGRLMAVWGVEACGEEDTYAWKKVEGAGKFTRITLTARNTGGRRWKQEVRRKMWQALDNLQPQVVAINGWAGADALGALAWGVRHQIPVVMMSESTAWDEPRVNWKEWIKNRLVGLCAAGLVGGTPHADYLAQLGMARERIFPGYDIVDNDYFATKANEARGQKTEVRKRLGLPENYFLASARFIEKKNLTCLLQAYAQYRKKAETLKLENQPPASGLRSPVSAPWDLVLLGDGPLQSSIFKLRSSLGLENCVHLPGFKQYEELPAYFGLAGAFIHASTTEQWGLVVNEAMASGLPVLVSHRCGCAENLVSPGVNGFQFDPANVGEMAQLLARVADARFPLADFGAASARLIDQWGPERFAEGLRAAVALALKQPPRGQSRLSRLVLRLAQTPVLSALQPLVSR